MEIVLNLKEENKWNDRKLLIRNHGDWNVKGAMF